MDWGIWRCSLFEGWAVVLCVCRIWRFILSTVALLSMNSNNACMTSLFYFFPNQCSYLSRQNINSMSASQRFAIGSYRVVCCVQNKTLKTHNKRTMADTRVTSIISTYLERISEKPYVTSTTYALSKLAASGVFNKLSIAFLFGALDVGSSFGRMWGWFQALWWAVIADNKYLGVSTLVLKTVTDGDVGRPYLLPHAVLQYQLGTVLGFSRVTWTS